MLLRRKKKCEKKCNLIHLLGKKYYSSSFGRFPKWSILMYELKATANTPKFVFLKGEERKQRKGHQRWFLNKYFRSFLIICLRHISKEHPPTHLKDQPSSPVQSLMRCNSLKVEVCKRWKESGDRQPRRRRPLETVGLQQWIIPGLDGLGAHPKRAEKCPSERNHFYSGFILWSLQIKYCDRRRKRRRRGF